MVLACVSQYEERAKELLPQFAFDYYRSGADDEVTLRLNKSAFTRLRIRSTVLRNVSERSTAVNILGQDYKFPVGVSPTAMQKLAHPDGELANARAAGAKGCIFTLSSMSTSSIEEVAKAAPDTTKWLQVYVFKKSQYEERAKELLPQYAFEYYRSGADDEVTLRLNKSAFTRLRIRSTVLRNVSERSTAVNILGQDYKFPVGVSPTAMQKLAHPDGELANARAAGAKGCIFTLSSMSTSSIEEVAEAAPDTTKWLQVYVFKKRALTESFIKRAEKVGYKALVVTVDSPESFPRRFDINNFFDLPPHLSLSNFTEETMAERHRFASTFVWEDIQWLKSLTKLPIILKGILNKRDAVLAAEYGADGIIVSNHGGRQLDYSPATIEVLPEIASAVGDKLLVMLDGGVSQGTDIYKALALGAKMVFVGRPALWGLAVNGQKGVENVLELLRREFEQAMTLSGCKNVQEITREMVAHESQFSKL